MASQSAADLFMGLSKGSPNNSKKRAGSSTYSPPAKKADVPCAFYTKVLRFTVGPDTTRTNSTCIVPAKADNGAAKALAFGFYGREFKWNPQEQALCGPTETTEMSRALWVAFQDECPNSVRNVVPDFSGFEPRFNPVPCNLTIALMANAIVEEEALQHAILVLIGTITFPLKAWLKREAAHGLDVVFTYSEVSMASGNMRKAWIVNDAEASNKVDSVVSYFQQTWGVTINVANLDASTM